MQRCFAGLLQDILAQVISQLLFKCFMRGDGEDRAADFCGAQRRLVFYVGKRLEGKSVGFVAAMDGHSPVTNPCTKSYSVCPPEEYLLEQCAVKMQSADVNKGQT